MSEANINPAAQHMTMFEKVFCPFSPLRLIKATIWKDFHRACTSGVEFYSITPARTSPCEGWALTPMLNTDMFSKIFYLVLGFCCHSRDAVSVVLCSTAALVPAIHT